MEPVIAICTAARLPSGLLEYRSVTAYGRTMSTSATVPGPRSGLDEGSVHDLWVDAAQVVMPVTAPHQGHLAPADDALVVPQDAADLVGNLPAYGG